jgi:hypothetical protein
METPHNLDDMLVEILHERPATRGTLRAEDRALLEKMVERADAGGSGFYACRLEDGAVDWFMAQMTPKECIILLSRCIESLASRS